MPPRPLDPAARTARGAGRPLRRVALLGAVLAVAVLGPAAAAQAVTVYAAASLRDAFPRIDGRATYSFAGSNQLQLQIERGAPADVFASASPDEAQALFRAGRCTRPVTFATNRLVLLVPRSNPAHLRSVYGLRKGGLRLAVGTSGVPIGDYTRRLLRRMRLSSALDRNRVSQETNVSGVVSKVALGSADAGFAYVTDGRSARGRVRAISATRAGPSRRSATRLASCAAAGATGPGATPSCGACAPRPAAGS